MKLSSLFNSSTTSVHDSVYNALPVQLDSTHSFDKFQNLFMYVDKSYLYTYMSNLLLIYFLYMFFKLILLSSIVELM